MKIPFTTQEFLEVFKNYNTAIWPLQLVFVFLAISLVVITVWKPLLRGRFVFINLSFFWLWMAAGYHLLFFSKINKAAYLFGVMFLFQGVLFLRYGFRKQIVFKFCRTAKHIAGVSLIFYALMVYPIVGHLIGHAYPYAPTFGLPCPTTIFTFGIVLLSNKRLPFYLLIIPLVWSLIGFSAVLSLGMYEDAGLLISALLTIVFSFIQTNRQNLPVHPVS